MNKQQIIEQLQTRHAEFRQMMANFSEAEYLTAPEGKWNAGQQLDHICRSVSPVNLAFGLPGFALRLFFGKANRPSRTYAALVEKYKSKLAAGGRASKPFVPKKVEWRNRENSLQRLENLVDALSKKVETLDDYQLDTLILPHPLLGKLTLREMLYFTIHHVQHHQAAVTRGVSQGQRPTDTDAYHG